MDTDGEILVSDDDLSPGILERSISSELDQLYDLFIHPAGPDAKRTKLAGGLYEAATVPTSQMSLKQAYLIIRSALEGNFDLNIPVRANASPILPSEPCFYVDSSISDKKRRRGSEIAETHAISVKYQSFYNAEVFWAEESGYLEGVCARGMSKRSRGSHQSEPHGYSGRWFTLVRRTQKDRDSDEPRRIRDFVVTSVSLVQFWKCPPRAKPFRSDKINSVANLETASIPSDQPASEASDGVAKVFKGNLNLDGDLFVDGDLAMNNLHVRGRLLVEGGISGQLITPTGAADYAEWFAYLDTTEKIRTGMVVQLRSPEQRITLDTSGEGPYMVVSTAPSVAAGVPYGSVANHGALCAFIGQVPVKVRGEVKVGEFIYPSGLNDGYAVSGKFATHKDEDALGTAMTTVKTEEGTLLCFVRWQHNVKWRWLEKSFDTQLAKARALWRLAFGILNLSTIIELAFLYPRPEFVWARACLFLRILFQINAYLHYPYVEFVTNKHVYGIWILDGLESLYKLFAFVSLMAYGADDFGPYAVFLLCGLVTRGWLFMIAIDVVQSVDSAMKVAAEQNVPLSDITVWARDALLGKNKLG